MQPLKSNSLELKSAIQYDQIKTLAVHPVLVNPKNGGLWMLSDIAYHSYENFHFSSTILHLAADLLEEKPIKAEHKNFKKTAKKTVNFYTQQIKERKRKKPSHEEKKALASDFRNVSKSHRDKACEKALAEARKRDEEVDAKLLEFAHHYGLFSNKTISELFTARGVPSDAADFIRHVVSGVVEIIVDGSNIHTAAAIINIDFSKNNNEIEKLKMLTERIELILDVFADKAAIGVSQDDLAELRAEVRTLLDEMRGQEICDLAVDCFEKRVNTVWKVSPNSALARICKLVHLLSQTYTLSVGKVTCYHTKDLTKNDPLNFANCPYKLLKMENFELRIAKEESRKIQLQFVGYQIKAQYDCKFNQVGGGLKVDQTVDIQGSLENLDKWKFSHTNLIHIPINEKTDNAIKLHRYWNLCNIDSKLIAQ